MQQLSYIIQLLYSGFAETTLVLFLLKVILTKYRQLWSELFLISNTILLCASIVYGLTEIIFLFNAWYSQVPGEQIAFTTRGIGPYWYTYWIIFWLPFLLPQLFWIRKNRKSPIASLLMLPFFYVGALIELYLIYLPPFRDSRPAAWTYYPPSPSALAIPFFVFFTLVLLLHQLPKKRHNATFS
jgi:molybdopterin-containing oxidoreductase family membrane subunit